MAQMKGRVWVEYLYFLASEGEAFADNYLAAMVRGAKEKAAKSFRERDKKIRKEERFVELLDVVRDLSCRQRYIRMPLLRRACSAAGLHFQMSEAKAALAALGHVAAHGHLKNAGRCAYWHLPHGPWRESTWELLRRGMGDRPTVTWDEWHSIVPKPAAVP